MSWRKHTVSLFAFIFLLTGCGYTLNHRLRKEFADPRGIYVPVFTNHTDEIGAETIFTSALIRELASRRQVKLSTREKGALKLAGSIDGISVSPTALTQVDFRGVQPYQRIPTEIGIRVVITLQLTDPKDNKVLWKKTFAGFRRVNTPLDRTFDFEVPSALGLITQSIWRSQYPAIARLIMRDIYDDMVDVF